MSSKALMNLMDGELKNNSRVPVRAGTHLNKRSLEEELVNLLNLSVTKRNIIFKYWNKGIHRRLYISDRGLFCTKKYKQIAYIDLNNFDLVVKTERNITESGFSNNDDSTWCKSQSESYKNKNLALARLAKICYYKLRHSDGKHI